MAISGRWYGKDNETTGARAHNNTFRMLATREVSEWKSIYNQIPLELESNRSLEAMRRMVTLSYNHLPFHLKSCFLYLSIFPEDFEIKRRRLVERWIAEGFVIAMHGVSVTDVGNSYFDC